MIFSLLAVVLSYILSVRFLPYNVIEPFLWAVGMALFIMWADSIVTAVSKLTDKKEDSDVQSDISERKGDKGGKDV